MSAHTDDGAKGVRFRIGVAARLTGIAAHTLRKWEERHGVVHPLRTASGERLYTAAQIDELKEIRALVDAGMEVAELARLDAAQRREAAQTLLYCRPAPVSSHAGQRPRVAIIGAGLERLVHAQPKRFDRLEVAVAAPGPEALDGAPVDALVLERETLHPRDREEVDVLIARAGAASAVVVYEFASHDARAALRGPGIALARAPIEPEDLQRLVLGTCVEQVRSGTATPAQAAAPARPRFERGALVELRATPVTLACRCPQYLAELLLSIAAFESYSAECESVQPRDARLHHFLKERAGEARALFEDALLEVDRVEGLGLSTALPEG